MNLKNEITKKDQNDIPKIRVVVRKRPANKREIQKNDLDIIDIENPQSLIVKELK
jgi:hypothetical protein